MKTFRFAASATLAMTLAAPAALGSDPAFASYYVGRDLRDTIPTGTYAGLTNPNFNRLSLLYAHTYTDAPATNHYHGKSPYTFQGANLGGATSVQSFNGAANGTPGNFLPEGTFGSSPRISLAPGSGVFASKYVSGLVPGQDFANLTFKSVDSLAGFAAGTGGSVLYNSGGNTGVTDPDGAGPLNAPNRWTGGMSGSNLLLKIAAISPGLSVANAGGSTILANVGDQHALGAGGSSLDFTPVLTASAPGDYSVTFTISDTGTANAGGSWLDSGQFTVNVSAVPEPGSLGALAIGGLLLARRGKRRSSLA